MSDFDRIQINSIAVATDDEGDYANGDVTFRTSEIFDGEIIVKVSVPVSRTDTLGGMQKALALKATAKLRDLAAISDDTIEQRLIKGMTSVEVDDGLGDLPMVN